MKMPFVNAVTRLFAMERKIPTMSSSDHAPTAHAPSSFGKPSKVTELHRFRSGPFKDADFEVISVDSVRKRKVLAFGRCLRIDLSDDELAKWLKE
jgi:hypothetical protein